MGGDFERRMLRNVERNASDGVFAPLMDFLDFSLRETPRPTFACFSQGRNVAEDGDDDGLLKKE